MQETGRLVRVFNFEIVEVLEESKEIDDVLEHLERRGATFHANYMNPYKYEMFIPDELDWEPFYETVLQCKAVVHASPNSYIKMTFP